MITALTLIAAAGTVLGFLHTAFADDPHELVDGLVVMLACALILALALTTT